MHPGFESPAFGLVGFSIFPDLPNGSSEWVFRRIPEASLSIQNWVRPLLQVLLGQEEGH